MRPWCGESGHKRDMFLALSGLALTVHLSGSDCTYRLYIYRTNNNININIVRKSTGQDKHFHTNIHSNQLLVEKWDSADLLYQTLFNINFDVLPNSINISKKQKSRIHNLFQKYQNLIRIKAKCPP